MSGMTGRKAWHREGMAIDAIAEASRRACSTDSEALGRVCDACDRQIQGEPAGLGLLMWTRGEQVRFEEPPLCEDCATAIGVTALLSWSIEEEEDG